MHIRSNSYEYCWLFLFVNIVETNCSPDERAPTIRLRRNVNVHMCEHIIDCVIVVVAIVICYCC